MDSAANFKESYDVHRRHGAFFTGGHVEWTNDGKYLLCQCEEAISVLNIETGLVEKVFGKSQGDREELGPIGTFALSSNNELIATFHRTGLFCLWKWDDEAHFKIWKSAHKGAVGKLTFGFCDRILVSGGTDGGIYVWDVVRNCACIHNLQGLKGVVSVLAYQPKCDGGLIFSAAGDAVIKAWSMDSNQPICSYKGHFSTVTAIVFDDGKNHMISCGRDKVLIHWDLGNNGCILHTIPSFECIEDMVIIHNPNQFSCLKTEDVNQSICVATGGENGTVCIWAVEKRKEVFRQNNSLVNKAAEGGGMAITGLLFNERESALAVVSADHNIIIHDFNTFSCKKQLVGFSDEVLNVVFIGKKESHLAVATNSRDIKVYDTSSFSCQLLKGHLDLVLTLSVAAFDPCLLASGGKDNMVILWKLDQERGLVNQLGVSAFHAASISCVAFSCVSASFLVSACEDACLKMWQLPIMPGKQKDSHKNLTPLHMVIAHQKTINGIGVAPNDKLIASASQDKSVKLWSVDKLEPVGVLNGHKRGVWTIRFSPMDHILASGSADATIKIWKLEDFSCWKTFEGHNSSVLRLEFISRGMQLLTSGGDGLMKLWTVKSGECTASWDAHEGHVWAMAVSKNEMMVVSGGSDSALVMWGDTTEERRNQTALLRESLVKREQMLLNLIQSDQLLSALSLALSLDRPLLVLQIIRDVLTKNENGLENAVRQLSLQEKEALLKCATIWNSNSKNCYPAQIVVSILLDELSVYNEDLKPNLLQSSIEEMIPYTERHFNRLSQVLQDLHMVSYTVSLMKPLITEVP